MWSSNAPALFYDRCPQTVLLLHHQVLMMTLCFLVLSLPLMLTSLAWHHLRFVLFPFCLLRSCLLVKGLYLLLILFSLLVAWSRCCSWSLTWGGRPSWGGLGRWVLMSLVYLIPGDDKQKLNNDLICFYPYRATTLAIVLTSWRRPSKCSLLRESGQASAHEPGSHQATCTPDPLSPSLGLSHQLRVCDNFLNSSMVLCLRYRRIGVQREGRGERKAW